MDKKTLEALKGSIKKWENIENWGGIDKGSDNCPLCQVFGDNDCEDCPVMMKTGKTQCNGSPWLDFRRHIGAEHSNEPKDEAGWIIYKVYCDECKRLARKEKRFLISLLYEGEEPKLKSNIKKGMNIEDFRTGMVIEFKDGIKMVVLMNTNNDNIYILPDNGHWGRIEELVNRWEIEHRGVFKVTEPKWEMNYLDTKPPTTNKIIWER